MRRRNGARGPFLGCSTYPRCKGSRNLTESSSSSPTSDSSDALPPAPAGVPRLGAPVASLDIPVNAAPVTGVAPRTIQLDADQAAVCGWRQGEAVAAAAAGSGKCLGKGTPVLMFDGSIRAVETICAGDLLMGPDSLPRKVLSTTRGTGLLYQIEPVKGQSWICNDVHTMTLAGTNKRHGQVRDVELRTFLAEKRRGRPDRDWKLLRSAVDFAPQVVPFDPYLLGLWLGDGTSASAEITNQDVAVREYCCAIAPRYGLEVALRFESKGNTYNIRFRHAGGGWRGKPHLLQRFFKSLVKNGDKTVPREYLVNDRSVRAAVLAGVLDTDGYYAGGSIDYVTKSKPLAEAVLFLARSLGFAAYANEKKGTIKSIGFTGIYTRISISGDFGILPLRVLQIPARRQIKRVNVTGWTARSIGEGEFFGFMVDGDGRFLLGDFTVTHNSTVLVERTADLIAEGVLPEAILILTFNKDAAISLRAKLAARLGGSVAERVRALTYHAYGLALLRRWQDPRVAGGIIGTDGAPSKAKIFNEILSDLKLKGETEDWTEIDERIREAGIDFTAEDAEDRVAQSPWGSGLALASDIVKVMRRYADGKASRNLVDFSDLICLAAGEFGSGSVRAQAAACYAHVMIDESQDTSIAQQVIALHLGAHAHSLLWVGDLRQAIYAWRGASPQLLTDRIAAGAAMLPIRTCRRSTAAIVEAGNVIARGREWHLGGDSIARPDAPMGARPVARMGGAHEVADEVAAQVANGASPADFFALVRVNALLADLECSLVARGLPVRVLGAKGGVWETTIGKLVRAYLHAAEGHATAELSRISNRPLRYAKGDAVRSAQERASSGYPLAQALRATGDRGALRFASDLERLSRLGFVDRCREIAELLVTDVEERAAGLKASPDDDRIETIRALCTAAAQLGSCDAIEHQIKTIREAPEGTPAVTLSTAHRSKGLESRHVFVVGCDADLFPHKKAEDVEEEQRLWYVAVTRAAETLTLLVSDKPSPFLTAMIEAGAVAGFNGGDGDDPGNGSHDPHDVPNDAAPTPADDVSCDERDATLLATQDATFLGLNAYSRGESRVRESDIIGPFAGPTPTDEEIGPDEKPAPGSKYVPVRLAAFRALLEPAGFTTPGAVGSEYIFERPVGNGVAVRVQTTVSVDDTVSREVGEDSIRITAIWTGPQGQQKPVLPREAWVCRTRNWRQGVMDRIERVTLALAATVVCPLCGAPTRERNGKFGAFRGCVSYPECRGTVTVPTAPPVAQTESE
jgi:superfamily I DNA/RNA helicase/ssDNA-binding Zn-finger/Zn-ribbon topoisomerase 1